MAILSEDYLLYIDTVSSIDTVPVTDQYFRPIVCLKTNGLESNTDVITIQNKCDGGYTKKRPGYGSWSMSGEGHAIGLRTAEKIIKANFQEILQLQIDKKMMWIALRDMDKSIWRVGLGFFTSIGETANMNEPYSFNFSFEGSGKLQIGTDLYITLLATNNMGTQFLEDGNENLIEVQGGITAPVQGGDTWNDNATWGG